MSAAQLSGEDARAEEGPAVESLVPAGGRFRGTVSFRGHARIEGRLEGSVVAEGILTIGETGWVVGDVDVDEVRVDGCVEGTIRARRRLELRPSARVEGALRSPRIALEEGCLLRGRCDSGAVAEVGESPR